MAVLDMHGKIGRRARAVRHVMDVYKSVILRPKFGAEEASMAWKESDWPISTLVFRAAGSLFRLQCTASFGQVRVSCQCIDNEKEDPWSFSPFHFHENHDYAQFGKVKQKALILMKKIASKPVYDTMME
jgi:hypothetical protein